VRPRSRAEERRLEKMGGERGKTSFTTPIFPTNPNPNHYTWKSPATPPPRPGDAFQLIVIACTGTSNRASHFTALVPTVSLARRSRLGGV